MDTKSKNNKLIGRVLSILLISLLCFSLIGAGYSMYNNMGMAGGYYSQPEFVSAMYNGSYGLYWKLQQQMDGEVGKTPTQVFYPGLYQRAATTAPLLENAFVPGAEDTDDSMEYNLEQLTIVCDNNVTAWYEELNYAYGTLDYMIADASGEHVFGRNEGDLLAFLKAKDEDDWRELRRKYLYYAVLSFDENGNLQTPVVHGADAASFDMAHSQTPEDTLLGYIGYGSDFSALVRGLMEKPAGVTCVFAVPQTAGTMVMDYGQVWTIVANMNQNGFSLLYVLLLFAAAVFGLVMAALPRFELNRWFLARMPLEISGLVAICTTFITFDAMVAQTLVETFNGTLLDGLVGYGMPADLMQVLGYCLCFVLLFLCFGSTYFAAASLWQARLMGIKEYATKKVWLVRFFRWIWQLLKRLWAWLTRIDLTDKSNRAILKLLFANLVVLIVLSAFWVFGIPLLIAYSVVLFFLMRRFADDIKAKYARLLDATRQMAQGKLDVTIEEDVGIFNPLKEELVKVQEGFAHAVQAETKSQNMKTELITNVSHDLKTPLTAIITYIGLLKKEETTDEERQSYIETLDRKSQQLKRLIEDLFEMSKASSRDITLNLSPIDLPALIRQVEIEARDELEKNNIEFRYRFPDKKIVLDLDSGKTSRIFENLILNVAKYALPGSRAYVLLRQQAGSVYIEIKNVSKAELDFDSEEITERFVRGDASRSSEGSGLGLAIAKSFTEAQGGSFQIAVDGDVFKAILRFPYLQAAEGPAEEGGGAPDTDMTGDDMLQ